MNARAKTIVLAFSLVSLLAAPFAEAARMGKSKSYGMRRAAPTQSYQAQPQAIRPVPAAGPQAQPPKQGVGVGTVIAAGAAGAAAGYLLGSHNDKPATAAASAASAPVEQAAAPAPAPKPGVPWGLVAILALVLVGGLWWFRRRVGMPAAGQTAPQGPSSMANDHRFDPIPQIGSGFPGTSGSQAGFGTPDLRRLPDGTETPYFLRQAKAELTGKPG
jgi:hypothetical protein